MELGDFMSSIKVDDLKKSIDVSKREWKNIFSTNCYAYALGIDVPNDDIYFPGIIGGDKSLILNNGFSYSKLIQNLILDFNALDLDYRESSSTDTVSDIEWKIALLINESHGICDEFHFLRQYEDGIWYHKPGWIFPVTNLDDAGKIITDPSKSHFDYSSYRGCYVLKKKRNR